MAQINFWTTGLPDVRMKNWPYYENVHKNIQIFSILKVERKNNNSTPKIATNWFIPDKKSLESSFSNWPIQQKWSTNLSSGDPVELW